MVAQRSQLSSTPVFLFVKPLFAQLREQNFRLSAFDGMTLNGSLHSGQCSVTRLRLAFCWHAREQKYRSYFALDGDR